MRLNRQSAIFIALLAIAIVVSWILLTDDGEDDTESPVVEATAETILLFPNVQETQLVSLNISAEVEVGDTRPTPIPGNPTLEPPTPLPEGVDPETRTESVTLIRDDMGNWVFPDAMMDAEAEMTPEATAEAEMTAEPEATVDPLTSLINEAMTMDTIDTVALDTALRTLVSTRSNRQFTPENGDYSQFGLESPSFVIEFTANPALITPDPLSPSTPDDAGGATELENYRLVIGSRTVGENAFYAQLNDDTETIYIITNATALQTSVLSLTDNVPLVAPPTPTPAPILTVPGPVFNSFLLNNVTDFTFTNNETGDVITLTRDPISTEWIYDLNGEVLPVLQPQLQVVLNTFGLIEGVQRTQATDLAALGLDTPSYTFTATDSTRTYTLQLGGQDATETIYYSLVDDFTDVVFVNATSVALLIDLFENPPFPPVAETTPEATAEMTAEASGESTPEAEMTAEATAESTEEPDTDE